MTLGRPELLARRRLPTAPTPSHQLIAPGAPSGCRPAMR